MPQPFIVPVTYAYSQTVYPFEGHGKVNGFSREWLATDNVAIPHVHGHEVEEVATLGFDDGASFVLLRHEGRLYRPVFAPGTHEPCGMDAFEEAANGMSAWLDNPFRTVRNHDSMQSNRPVKPFREGKSSPDPENWRKLGDSGQDERSAELATVGNNLLVVDGIVHRPCDAPVLVLKSPTAGYHKPPTELRLCWSMDRLESDDDPVTGPTTIRWRAQAQGHRGSRAYQAIGQDAEYGERSNWRRRAWRVFGLNEGLAAKAFGEAMAAMAGVAFKVEPSLVTVERPWHLPDRPKVSLALYAKTIYSAVEYKLTKMSREMAMDWFDARDVGPGKDPVRVLELMGRVLDRPEDLALLKVGGGSDLTNVSPYGNHSDNADGEPTLSDGGDAVAALLRYRMVERSRAETADIDAHDAEALADLGDFPELEGPGM